ncbi:putative cell surface protein [Aspergillus melleus]|uniref:putative cell surface protein n=1 Tax=Aspergillus melleus TaxID=138277 RepID=UPI001E8E6527|nr:uncharacterized protein LDX57_010544 [Aspergillus melleus]KAH8432912.1 hypothetical protein LDX57_010544 [Aspergillus melleus]
MKAFTLPVLISAGLVGLASARTDLGGCVSSATVNQWNEASMIWYVPDSGEICDIPDCGGGRAPPKYNQPGCAAYTGTETLTPSYLPGWGPNGKSAATTAHTASATTVAETSAATTTSAASSTDESTSSSSTKTKHGSTLITAGPTLSKAASSTPAGSSSPVKSSSVAGGSKPSGTKGSGSGSGSDSGSGSGSGTKTGSASTGLATGAASSVSGSSIAGVAVIAALVGVVGL